MKSIEAVDMRKALGSLKEYVDTYDQQSDWERYRSETYVNDVLYGLGISISDEFRFAEGFDRFKEVLREHLGESKGDPK